MRYLIAGLILLCAPGVWAQAVVQAHPIAYELLRLSGEQRQVLASGERLLREGLTEHIRSEGAADLPHTVQLSLTVQRTDNGEARLAWDLEVDLALAVGQRRVELEGQPGSFIQGPQLHRVRFGERLWRAPRDTTPIQLVHESADARYVLTVLPQPGP